MYGTPAPGTENFELSVSMKLCVGGSMKLILKFEFEILTFGGSEI
jgi:hypothetical protein